MQTEQMEVYRYIPTCLLSLYAMLHLQYRYMHSSAPETFFSFLAGTYGLF
jgi:hypothetical protein